MTTRIQARNLSPLACNIKHAIASAGFTQKALAYELGVSRRTLWAWTSGSSVPREAHLHALARLCGITAESLRSDAPAQSAPQGRPPIHLLESHWSEDRQAWIVDIRLVLPPEASSR